MQVKILPSQRQQMHSTRTLLETQILTEYLPNIKIIIHTRNELPQPSKEVGKNSQSYLHRIQSRRKKIAVWIKNKGFDLPLLGAQQKQQDRYCHHSHKQRMQMAPRLSSLHMTHPHIWELKFSSFHWLLSSIRGWTNMYSISQRQSSTSWDTSFEKPLTFLTDQQLY